MTTFLVACSLLLLFIPVSLAHRCYVCLSRGLSADDALHLFPQPPKLQYCDKFRPGDPKFIRECPAAEYPSCLTKVQGKNVMRTCSDLALEINDCKLANNIQYCYCYGKELCNIGNLTASRHLEDDEDDDFPEGSGGGRDDYHRKLHATKAPAPHGTTSSTKDADGTSLSNIVVLPTYRTLLCLILLVALTSL